MEQVSHLLRLCLFEAPPVRIARSPRGEALVDISLNGLADRCLDASTSWHKDSLSRDKLADALSLAFVIALKVRQVNFAGACPRQVFAQLVHRRQEAYQSSPSSKLNGKYSEVL